MGLFSNNKKLCPICGSPTPRLLATKVEDMPLCKECAGKVDLPDGVLERMSLDQFKKYIAYYDENQALRDAFKETDRMSFGFLSGELLADTEHRLLRRRRWCPSASWRTARPCSRAGPTACTAIRATCRSGRGPCR